MILIVGENSFLAKNLLKHYENAITCSHSDFHESLLSRVDTVINFAFNPRLYSEKYKKYLDIDLLIANKALDRDIKYIMVSSRKVYGAYKGAPFNEMDECNPIDFYGENKLIVETNLKKILGDNLCILRVGNVLGEEFNKSRLRFGAYMLNQLIKNNGSIYLNLSPNTIKNIISLENFSEIVIEFCEKKIIPGIYNVGSNNAVNIGLVAEKLIQGFDNGGKVIVTRDEIVDQFDLDIAKMSSAVSRNYTNNHLISYLMRIGNLARRLSEC